MIREDASPDPVHRAHPGPVMHKTQIHSISPAPRISMRVMVRLWVLTLIWLVGLPAFPVLAQSAGNLAALPAPITLRDGQDSYDLNNNLFITPDPLGQMSYASLIDRHMKGMRGALRGQSIITLGTKPVPHWMVFALNNQSNTSHWTLSLGRHGDGRYGVAQQIYLYDHLNQRRILTAIKTATADAPSPKDVPTQGAAISFDLPVGRQALMVLYVVPEGGGPVTLAPTLKTDRAFFDAQNNPWRTGAMIRTGLIALLGLFAGALIFRRMIIAGGFMAYYAANMAAYMIQNDVIYDPAPLASETSPLLFAGIVAIALLLSRFFLNLSRGQTIEKLIIYGCILLIGISITIGTMAIPDSSILRPMLITGIPVAALAFLSLFCFAQGHAGTPAANIMGTGWLIGFAGALTAGLAVLGILPPTPIMVNAYWIALFIQAPVFIIGIFVRSWAQDAENISDESLAEDDVDALGRLKQTKESVENARLLKVIEHERQTLEELRERELKQTEEMRIAKETADAANRSKSAFLAVISHEIRTPMTGIMGMVRLLLDSHLTRDQVDYARTIQDSGDAMIALLNDILDFEKIESGKMDLENVDFDLHRMINGVVTLMSGHATQKSISLTTEIGPDVPRFIKGDPVRLRQVLLNLVGNSIKFTSEGGVTIVVRREGGDADHHRLYFAVRDTGAGISPDAQKNLFNPFAQADSSISRKFGGTGLGLAICQRLITAMGGTIAINSKEGQGSTFFYTITMEHGHAAGVQEPGNKSLSESGAAPSKSLRILCVDDNEINQKLLQEFVSRMGHKPTTCGSGEDALKIIESHDFDMVFMDIELPGISGMGATRAIRAMRVPQKSHLPVIALTGNVRDDDIRQCYAANMNGHLAKPIDPAQMKAQIEKVLRGKLDNPVIVEDDGGGSDTFTPVHETVVSIEDPQEMIEDDAPILPGQMDQSDAMADIDTPVDDIMEAQITAERAPIMQAALQDDPTPLDLAISEDELDEDSFVQALDASTDAELGDDFFDDDFDDIMTRTEELPPPPAMNGTIVFDSTLLDGLKGSMDQASLNEMMGGLMEKVDEIITHTNGAMHAHDMDTIRARMHELKGMCGNFGLQELSLIAEHAEKAVKEGQIDTLPDVLSALPAAGIRAHKVIGEWLQN